MKEGNEIEKAAVGYIVSRYGDYYGGQTLDRIIKESFTAGANWQKERENAEIDRLRAALKSEVDVNRVFRVCNEKDMAELTRANARIEELTTRNLELERKYDDLYTKYYGK